MKFNYKSDKRLLLREEIASLSSLPKTLNNEKYNIICGWHLN